MPQSLRLLAEFLLTHAQKLLGLSLFGEVLDPQVHPRVVDRLPGEGHLPYDDVPEEWVCITRRETSTYQFSGASWATTSPRRKTRFPAGAARGRVDYDTYVRLNVYL